MTDRLHVRGGRTLLPGGWSEADLLVEGGRIDGARGRRRPDAGARILDAAGLLVVPGLVDLQVNGGLGHDFTREPASIWRVGARLPRHGVTAFLPTLVSPRPVEVRQALDVLASGPPSGYVGATPLGVHCEGPMIARRRRGVHPPARLRSPTSELVEGWSRARGVRLVTLAPELAGADAVARALTRRGVVVSAGHSDASFDEAVRSFDRGVRAGTHLFNAMSGFHHRDPGLVGALLFADGIPAGLIGDGVHVHPAAFALAWRTKGGPSGIVLVTDASPMAGSRRGTAAGLRREGGVATDPRGVIAGGLIMLDRIVRNAVAFASCDPADAIRAATEAPSRLLGEPSIGAILPGSRADLAILDARLRVVAAVIGGRVVFDGIGRGRGSSAAVSPSRRTRPRT